MNEEDKQHAEAQPPEREQPEYRSYMPKGPAALPKLKEEDKVIFQLSKTQTPTWTIDTIHVDKDTKEKTFKLRKSDGSFHDELVKRENLTPLQKK